MQEEKSCGVRRTPVMWSLNASPWMKEMTTTINNNERLVNQFCLINKWDHELFQQFIVVGNNFERCLNKLIYSILGQTFIDTVYAVVGRYKQSIIKMGYDFNGYVVNAMRLIVLNAMPITIKRMVKNDKFVYQIFGDKEYVRNWRTNLIVDNLFV